MKNLQALELRTGSHWHNLRAARRLAEREQAELTNALARFGNADASVVVVGSLARQEFTSGSDIDWTILLDGISRPQDEDLAREVRAVLSGLKKKQPGPEGTFGKLGQ